MSGKDRTANQSRPAARVLVIEDEADIAALVAYQLTRDGYRVETASNGAQGLNALHRELPDLVVLDRMLPGVSGDDILRAIRSDTLTRDVPVLFLTAKRQQEDRIQGLELGADDYLTKPFSPRELVLRVEAILRRAQGEGQANTAGGRVLRAGGLKVDLSALRVTSDGQELTLTPTEFRLLTTLLERRGRTQTRRQLLEEAWLDAEVADRKQTRTVDMHVRRLRSKLGAAGDLIETVRGFGYRFRKEES
ncbi:MAG: response regulator transcription factor [Gemmatimonadota bacterium]|nr:response regulator transcription factor [Gemmatimonadota bacterium]